MDTLQQPTWGHWFYNNSLFVAQVGFGLIGVGFSGGMLIAGQPAATYLPVMTAIFAYFMPSPVNHQISVQSPSGIPQLKQLLARNQTQASTSGANNV